MVRVPRRVGARENSPPSSGSSRAAKIDGLSRFGQQRKSMVPSSATSAAVRRLPIIPCSPIARGGTGFGAPPLAIVTKFQIERHATVDKQRRSGHIVGLIRGEPDRRACHV